MPQQAVDVGALVQRAFAAIEAPGSQDLEALIRPAYRNWEADGPDAELRGPAAYAASVANLNRAFSEIRFEIVRTVSSDDTAAVRAVLHGVHSGPMRALPATGRPFHQSQSHWFRLVDGQIAEHWANRDDLGFLHQVGAAPGARVGGR